jgi:hypothetical protein
MDTMFWATTLFEKLFPGWTWKLRCPRTIEAIVEHLAQSKPWILDYLSGCDQLPTIDSDPGITLSHVRQISYTYGISDPFESPTHPDRPSWNRALLRNYPQLQPGEIVYLIHRKIWGKVRAERVPSSTFETATRSASPSPQPSPRVFGRSTDSTGARE